MPIKVIGFPSLYVQGPGALDRLGPCLGSLADGGAVVALVDPFVMPLFKSVAAELGDKHGIRMNLLAFTGECTRREIDRLVAAIGDNACTAIVGVGGGKALDTAKAVAHALSVSIVIVPTIASSDAPTSRLMAIYDENHKIVEVPLLRRNPDAVLVDTSVIRSAPRRFFVAGIGDAITKKFEVADSVGAGLPNFFQGAPTRLASLLAESCYQVIRTDAVAAMEVFDLAVPSEVANAAFERVVEATVLYSGLAFEGGGLSIAHGMLRGITAYPQTQQALHGELVAYGLLVQLAANGFADDALLEIRDFLVKLGLPVCLADIGLPNGSDNDIRNIASLTFEAPYVAARHELVSRQQLAEAIVRVESL
ncbi:MAG: glycerol dehydrogenase [Rhodopseudomonas sp.]|uniref:glycerol dehydrogenase n=1 Tax=Rhodopseudomonas sp. TaxID=1078 RepID=UPI00184B1150|nr:glycerol dehydrogenase [Rhodopseudomonas sp.]NVN87789.1 glycerol dehydrogenase [Rhodopseudomonas sp.]